MRTSAGLLLVFAGCAPQGPPLPERPAPLPLAEAAATQNVLYVCDVNEPGLPKPSRMTIGDEGMADDETWCAVFHYSDALQCFSRQQTRGIERFTSSNHGDAIAITPDGAMTFSGPDEPTLTGTCLKGKAA